MDNKDLTSTSSTEKSVEAGLSRATERIPSTVERLVAVSSITVGNILVIGGLGWWADSYFHTSPWILIGSLIIAFISTQIMIYRTMMRLMGKK